MIIDFESGVSGWTVSNPAAAASVDISVETANPGGGLQSLRLESLDGLFGISAKYDVTGLDFGAWKIRYKAAAVTAFAGQYTGIVANGTYAGYGNVPDNVGTWGIMSETGAYSRPFWSPGSFTIRAYGSSSAAGDYYLFDDIEFVPFTGWVEDFETYPLGGYSGNWNTDGYSTAVADNLRAHSGTQSFHISSTYGYSNFRERSVSLATDEYHVLPRVWGMDMELSAWVWVPSGQPDARVGFVWNDAATFADDHVQYATSTTNNTWEHLTLTVPYESLVRYGSLNNVGFNGNITISGDVAADGDPFNFWLDDLSVSSKFSPTWDGVIRSDDFEYYLDDVHLSRDNDLGWHPGAYASIVLDPVTMHSGTQSMSTEFSALPASAIVTEKAYVRTRIPGLNTNSGLVDPVASIWVHVPTGSSPVVFALYNAETDGLVVVSDTSTMLDAWEQLSITVPADSFPATDGSLAIFPTDETIAGSLVYVDDLLITYPTTVRLITGSMSAPVALSGNARTYTPPTEAQLQGRENIAVNRGLTPQNPNPFTGLCLNDDIQLGDLRLNTIDLDGVVWVVTDLDGWWVHPDPEVKDYPRGMGDGSYDVQGRWLARNLTLSGTFLTPDSSYVPYARDNLIRATNIVHSGTWLRVDENPTKVAYVRLSGRPQIRTVNARGRTEFSIGLRAADPVKYSWNDADPDGYTLETIPCASNTESGQGVFTNVGNTAVKIIIQIDGPIVGPATIQNTTTGELILIIGSTAPGTVLEINTYDQVVALDGDTFGMRSLLDAPTDWIRLTPGNNNFEFVDTGDTDSSAVMRIYYRSGWIG